jgi:hypothetical protein
MDTRYQNYETANKKDNNIERTCMYKNMIEPLKIIRIKYFKLNII